MEGSSSDDTTLSAIEIRLTTSIKNASAKNKNKRSPLVFQNRKKNKPAIEVPNVMAPSSHSFRLITSISPSQSA